jgi:hypothetical protein
MAIIGGMVQALSDITNGELSTQFFCILIATLSTTTTGIVVFLAMRSIPMSALSMMFVLLLFANVGTGVIPLLAVFMFVIIVAGVYLISRPGAI